MFSTKALVRAALLAASCSAAALTAQDFDGQVQTDPRADLAIYDFHFSGPPSGHAALFLSAGLGLAPFDLPGLGRLYLDPLSLFPVTPSLLTLDAGGQGRLRLTVPSSIVRDTPLCFQAVFVDTQSTLRLTQDWLALIQGVEPAANPQPGYQFRHKSNAQDVQVEFLGAPGGQGTIEIRDARGNLAGSASAPIGPSGRSAVTAAPINGPIQNGHSYTIRYQPPGGGAMQTIGQGRF